MKSRIECREYSFIGPIAQNQCLLVRLKHKLVRRQPGYLDAELGCASLPASMRNIPDVDADGEVAVSIGDTIHGRMLSDNA